MRSLGPRLPSRALGAVAITAVLVATVPALAGPDAAPEAGVHDEALLPGDIDRGDDAYVRLCVECHATPSRIVRRVPGEDAAARTVWLEDFLPEHYAPDAQDRLDLIEYMLSL